MHSIIYEGIEYRFYDHLYAVSADGKVLRKMKPYHPRIEKSGYVYVGRQRLLHRMVAICWIEKPQEANHVHHINEIRADNRSENLMWVTPKRHMNEFHEGISKGHHMSPEGRQRLRSLRLGTKHSEDTKQKQHEASIRLGYKPPPRSIGYKCSSEAIRKMRNNHPKNTSCVINGTIYKSFNEAERQLHIKAHTIRKRCLSHNFPDYQFSD